MNELERIVARTRAEVARRRASTPLGELDDPPPRRPFLAALQAPGLSLIAEHKRSSPSAGRIRADVAIEDVVGAYERGGAAALSILTEGPSFGGSLEDLRAARAASRLPLLRKDFILDPYQVYEAAAGGADAILLIVGVLGDRDLHELYELAGELGLAALVEVHDADELERAAALGARIVGINNRNLDTLEVDTRRTHELLERVPAGCLCVAESGFSAPGELTELACAGVDAVLVGESLMRAADIEAACHALVAAGAAAPAGGGSSATAPAV